MFGVIEDFYRDNKNQIFMDHLIKCAALFKYIEYLYGVIDLDNILLPLLFTMESTLLIDAAYRANFDLPQIPEPDGSYVLNQKL
jgi:hypothetical protein